MKVVQAKRGEHYFDAIHRAINKANERTESVLFVVTYQRDNVFAFVVKPRMDFEDIYFDFDEWLRSVK